MVTKKNNGVSLMSALLLITIVMMVATAMAGVFTINMNVTNRVSNSTIALSEAEAGIAEVLYQITRDENIEGSGDEQNPKNPKINWGLNGETIRSTITPSMSEEEAYHVVTFDSSSSFPYSTNNTGLDRDTGYLGRVIPDGTIHIVSTGYCKGQFRTVECVIEKPPFPFGLATSGAIRSATPIKVKGTSSLAGFSNGEEDRPGHIVCNSPEGITIGTKDGEHTEISGFVKSSGPVSIAQPAVVRGGIRSFADQSTITDINIQDFNLESEGAAGVVTILDSRFDQDQNLDVLYKYSGSHLEYMGSVNLEQAMLWIDGDLTIHGPVTGEGLIVVNGNANFLSGSSLNGSDKMAVLAKGDITIDGRYSYFSGLVYTEGDLKAKNVTIVGNAVANSSDPNKGGAELDNVTMISNEQTGDMTITITSGNTFDSATNLGHKNAPNLFDPGNPYPEDDEGWIAPEKTDQHMKDVALGRMKDRFMGTLTGVQAGSDLVPFVPLVRPGYVGNAGGLWDDLQALEADVLQVQEDYNSLQSEISSLISQRSNLDEDSDTYNADYQDLSRQISEKKAEQTDLLAAADAAYDEAAVELAIKVRDWVRDNANDGGNLGSGSVTEENKVVRNERFNLNEYLPQSERVKMSFWRVYPRKL